MHHLYKVCPVALLCLLWIVPGVFSQGVKVSDLRCAYRVNPLGVEASAPRLSWEIRSLRRGVLQTAYRVLVSEDSGSLGKNRATVWDSKKVYSAASIQVPVAFAGVPAKTYYWKVMVWDNGQDSSQWSGIASWQAGLSGPADWKGASWIGYADLPDSGRRMPMKGDKRSGPERDTLPLFRKAFTLRKPLRRGTAFICGLGHFEMSLNGRKVGDHFLDPGWTRYDRQALYVPLDITGQLHKGVNVIGVMLGNGFYYVPWERYHKLTVAFGYPKMIARIMLEYADGSVEDIVSDTSWQTASGPILFSSIYGGEDYDARKERRGWNMPGGDDKGWRASVVVTGPEAIRAQAEEPLKVFDHFLPRKVTLLKGGAWIYDLGQNASGIPQVRVSGRKGQTIRIIPAELVNTDGTADQKATGNPCYFEYTLKGEGVEVWQPRFSYYGFRYLQVEGAVPEGRGNASGLPVIIGLKGLHTRNAAERVGSFSCSNVLFRRTDTLIDWAIRSNMASVFTDCPHREKLGWLEEAHLMGSSVRYNYDIASIYRKIIHDMMDAQTDDGLVPEIAPEFVQFYEPFRDSPEWASSCVLVPWYLYQWYGDRETLAESYPMMQRYMAYLEKKAKDHILYQGLGDWYDIGPAHPGVSQLTPKGVTATAIYYYDLSILEKMARLLGREEEAGQYAQLAMAVKGAFVGQFLDRQTMQVASGSQTANAMAVYMGLIDSADREAVVANIVKDLRNRNNSLTAGDIGYRYLLKVLEEEGRSDVIFDMNNRSDVPGYGYQLAHGATALTESWQAFPSVSNNHFMLGHIMEWFYAGLAGIKAADTDIAFHDIVLRPALVGDIRWARGEYRSPYGMIASFWNREGGVFDWRVRIPVNTMARVYLPAESSDVVTEGGRALTGRKDIRVIGYEKGAFVLRVGSGSYRFKRAAVSR